LKKYLPVLEWLPGYQKGWLRFDIIAGLSVWALLVPQSVAYASIVGVPAQYGLYTAAFALIGYALFGTSRQVITGPSATVSAVSASVVALIAASGSPEWITFTATLAAVAGCVYILMGLLRMGWIANFLSNAVLGGFIFGFGIGLSIDQSHKIIGVPKVDGSYWQMLTGTIRELPNTNYYTLAIGAVAIVFMLAMRRLAPRWPRALIVAALGIAASAALDVTAHGVKIVGEIPTGLPSFTVPDISLETISTILLGSAAVIMVGFSESLASAKEEAVKHDYEIDASQEMIAQGAASGLSGLFGGFVVDGSLSKTTVADLAGQRTQMASLFTSGLIVLTIVLLVAIFTDLPEAVLGAIVIDAAIGLIKLPEFKRVMKTSKRDFAAYVAAMAGLLFVGVLAGVVIGVILSLLLLIASASKSPVRRMAYNRQKDFYVEAATNPEAELVPDILVTEINGPLFFADAANFKDRVTAMVEQDKPHAVVIDMDRVTMIDMDGADVLSKLNRQLSSRKIKVGLARVGFKERDLLGRTGTLEEIGHENLFDTVREAVEAMSVE